MSNEQTYLLYKVSARSKIGSHSEILSESREVMGGESTDIYEAINELKRYVEVFGLREIELRTMKMSNEPKFKVGEVVYHKASGEAGVVTKVIKYKYCQTHDYNTYLDWSTCIGYESNNVECRFDSQVIYSYELSESFNDNKSLCVNEKLLTNDREI